MLATQYEALLSPLLTYNFTLVGFGHFYGELTRIEDLWPFVRLC